ncbi:MAG: hypothetical protein CL758_08120 [Chloroflexi bacterium]|nr:hypothetical protein [Chloroflexota bacterium]|tara:strand:+ start:4889 stop:5482 length:594 start_codon:yes stop_codon:yes gene_type:complete
MNIPQISGELEGLIENGMRVPGFRKKVLIDIEKLTMLAEAVQAAVPANIQEADEVLRQKDSIINQAYLEAQRIKTSAEQESRDIIKNSKNEHAERVQETQVLKTAKIEAEQIINDTMAESNKMKQDAQKKLYDMQLDAESISNSTRDGADAYAREVLCNLEEQLAESLGRIRRGIDALHARNDKNITSDEENTVITA